MEKRIFITGGHYTPARAVIQKLQKYKLFYIGRKYSMEGDGAIALEYTELSHLSNLSYLSILTGRIQRQFFVNVLQSFISLFKIFIGIFQAFFWVVEYDPDLILSFGGYVGAPIVLAGWVLGIPIITHEQTLVYGRANKFIAFLANKVLVSWPDSLKHFPASKVILTGNPLREEILKIKKSKTKNKTIYITGGSQGAHAINLVVESILPKLLEKYYVIHQTGDSQFKDFDRLTNYGNEKYKAIKFLNADQMAQALIDANLVISRAGANIVSELLFLHKPCVLIPIPGTFGNEQEINAGIVQKTGVAEVILQKELTGERLLSAISLLENRKIKNEISIDPLAADKIVTEVEKMLG